MNRKFQLSLKYYLILYTALREYNMLHFEILNVFKAWQTFQLKIKGAFLKHRLFVIIILITIAYFVI